jgi:hypothetical protein
MNKIKKRALDEVLPPAERDAMTIFVIENRPVLDTLRATLEYVSSGSWERIAIPERRQS